MIAEVDLKFLRWGYTEAKNRNRKKELTGKDVAKKIAKESGPALRKGSETELNNAANYSESRARERR